MEFAVTQTACEWQLVHFASHRSKHFSPLSLDIICVIVLSYDGGKGGGIVYGVICVQHKEVFNELNTALFLESQFPCL